MVTCNGQAQLRSVIHGKKLLHQAFTERAAAHYDSPVPVLDGPGNNFTSRCRPFIHDHHNRRIDKESHPGSLHIPPLHLRSFGIKDQLALGQELFRHEKGCPQVAPAVPLQVQNQSLRHFIQVFESINELILRCQGKLVQLDIHHTRGSPIGCIHAVNGDLVTDHLKIQRSRLSPADHGQGNPGSLRAPQQAEHLLVGQFGRRNLFPVHGNYPVIGADPYGFGRSSRNGCHHHQRITDY